MAVPTTNPSGTAPFKSLVAICRCLEIRNFPTVPVAWQRMVASITTMIVNLTGKAPSLLGLGTVCPKLIAVVVGPALTPLVEVTPILLPVELTPALTPVLTPIPPR